MKSASRTPSRAFAYVFLTMLMTNVAKIPMITITISNSMSVKPRCALVFMAIV